MVSKELSFVPSDMSELNNKFPKPSQEDFINSSISEHQFKKEDSFPYSDYVVYKIDLTSSIKKWSVWKRYNDFKELRDKISDNNYILNLPDFPEKKYFNSKSNDTIKSRKKKLAEFLNFLLRKMKIQYYKEVIEFIEIDKETLSLISKKSTLCNNISNTYLSKPINLNMVQKSNSMDISTNFKYIDNYYVHYLEYKLADSNTKTAYMQLIEEFLHNLSQKAENKTNVIKNFDTFLKSKKIWPQFKPEEIQRLYFGEFDKLNNVYKLQGLLYHIGAIEENQLGAEECLQFLVKLLQTEYNPEYDKYIGILKSMKKEHLEIMNLAEHLEINKTKIKQSVFKLISCLYEKNNQKLDDILDECGLLKPYKQYSLLQDG